MKFDMEKTREAYAKKGCNVSATCKAVGISRMHFYRMREKNEKFAEGLNEAYEAMIDNVESKLLSKINDGDTTALIFFLKTKGKKRGYVEGNVTINNIQQSVASTNIVAQVEQAKINEEKRQRASLLLKAMVEAGGD